MAEAPKSALITGAGSGIGRATALRFLTEGWEVIAVGRRAELLNDLVKASPSRVTALPCDLSRPDAVQELCSRIESDPHLSAALSVLVNNAGAYERKSLSASDETHWRQMFEANLFAPVRLTRGLQHLLEKNRGAVINVSSTLGLKPVAQTGAYSAAKAAMVNWTKTLALELAPSGARANCACPGIVDTPIHPFHAKEPLAKAKVLESLAPLQPLGRIGEPSEVAHAIWSLAGAGSEWMTGAILTVDGGITLV